MLASQPSHQVCAVVGTRWNWRVIGGPAIGPVRPRPEILRSAMTVCVRCAEGRTGAGRNKTADKYLATGDVVANLLHVSFEGVRHKERRGTSQFEIRPVDNVIAGQSVVEINRPSGDIL